MEWKKLYLICRNKHGEAAKTRRQSNVAQMKGQIKTPEKELNEMEISNLSNAELKTLVIKLFKELSEDLNSMKKIQSEMKFTLRNNLQGNNSRVDEVERQINDLEHKEAKNNQSEQEEKRIQKTRE